MMKEIPDYTDYGAHIELVGDCLRGVERAIVAKLDELRSHLGKNNDTLFSQMDEIDESLMSICNELEHLNSNARLIAKAIAGRCTEEDFL